MKINTENTSLHSETVAITKIVKNESTNKRQRYTIDHILTINPTIRPRLRTIMDFGFNVELLTRGIIGDLLQITTDPSEDERSTIIIFARDISHPSRAVITR